MTDLEITKLCAEALGIQLDEDMLSEGVIGYWDVEGSGRDYSPLHDDAQAMALVAKLRLRVMPQANGHWCADNGEPTPFTRGAYWLGQGDTINRAICECVAKMKRTDAAGQPDKEGKKYGER